MMTQYYSGNQGRLGLGPPRSRAIHLLGLLAALRCRVRPAGGPPGEGRKARPGRDRGGCA